MSQPGKADGKSDTLSIIEAKVEAQSQAVETIRFIYSSAQESNDKFIKHLSVFGSIVAFVIGFGTIVNGWYQADRVTEAVKQNDKSETERNSRISKFFDEQTVKQIFVFGALNDRQTMEGALSIDPKVLGDRIIGFEVTAEFPFKISYLGSRTAMLNAYKITYSKEFASVFHDNTDDLLVRQNLIGSTFTANTKMVPDARYDFSFSLSVTRKTCAEAEAKILDILAHSNPGSMTIAPIFEAQEKSDESFSFNVKLAKSQQAYDCEYLDRYR